jgi:tetratricopeptide (TPR) repeat protein
MGGAVEVLTGKLAAARTRLERSVELARQYSEVENEGWALAWLADLAFYAGDQDVGLPAAQRSVELAEKVGSSYSRISAYTRLGVALLLGGRVNEALETLEHTLTLTRQCGTGLEGEARLLAWLAEAVT